MPEWDYDDEDDNQSSPLVKDLRKQLTEAKKANKELTTELGTLRPQVRKSSISSVLSDLGYNTKIAALLPEGVEPTKEAVKAWVDEYGDVFNLGKAEEVKPVAEAETKEEVKPLAGQTTQPVDQATQDMWARVQSGEAATGVTAPDIEKQQLAQLGAAMAAANGSPDQFFAILRGEKALP